MKEGVYIREERITQPVIAGLPFNSMLELNAFWCWWNGKGAEEFNAWFKGMEKLRGTECEKCKWRDPTQFQCFDGHGQYRQRKECEGFEKGVQGE